MLQSTWSLLFTSTPPSLNTRPSLLHYVLSEMPLVLRTANLDVYFHTYCTTTNMTFVAIIDTNATISEHQAFRHQFDRRLFLITAGGLVLVFVVACIAAHYYISCQHTRISAAGRRLKTRKLPSPPLQLHQRVRMREKLCRGSPPPGPPLPAKVTSLFATSMLPVPAPEQCLPNDPQSIPPPPHAPRPFRGIPLNGLGQEWALGFFMSP